jgi:phosphatidylglycerophosphate synthase
LVILLVQHRLPTPALMAVLVRDAYVMAGFFVLNRRGITLPVILLGKLSTAVLLLALLLAILGVPAGVYVFWGGVALSLLSAAVYTKRGIRQFRRPRAGVLAGR